MGVEGSGQGQPCREHGLQTQNCRVSSVKCGLTGTNRGNKDVERLRGRKDLGLSLGLKGGQRGRGLQNRSGDSWTLGP